jgi:hypothetical protein
LNRITPNLPLAIVFFAALAAVAFRAAARQLAPRRVPGTEPAPVTVTADGSQPSPAVTTGTHDGAGRNMARSPGPSSRPASAVEQMQHVFHELHANGRNTVCVVCDGQYGPA